MVISPVRPVDLFEALGLLRGRTLATDEMSAEFFQQFVRDEQTRHNILVAYDGNSMIGVVFAQCLPGASAIIWPPQTRLNNPTVEDALVVAALKHVADAKMVQAFLTPEQFRDADSLLRNGFQHVTRVLQMEWHGEPPLPNKRVSLRPFADWTRSAFEELLRRCHEETLDCPELNGLRTPTEVFFGHLDAAPDTTQWWVVESAGKPVGVLIMNDTEISFLGVLSDSRKRGIGRAVLEQAARSSTKMSLIVDIRNVPATRLYRSFGFTEVGFCEILLRKQ